MKEVHYPTSTTDKTLQNEITENKSIFNEFVNDHTVYKLRLTYNMYVPPRLYNDLFKIVFFCTN